MILFIDDQPTSLNHYVAAIETCGYEVRCVDSTREALSVVDARTDHVQCVILDVMFPNDGTFSAQSTNDGLTTGMPLFASLRARLPHVPVIVLTNSLDARVEHWFKTQDRCFFCRKVDLLPAELADMIRSVALFDADALVARLQNCKPGPDSAYEYQTLCIDILKYLFIPPMKDVHAQAARQDGHEVRDAVIHNECTSGFWWAVYNEFSARHIVVEFKNYTAAVRKSEVAQLRRYLGRKSLGRFGIILSRMPPSDSALTEQRDAYGENDIMILFLSDSDLVGMIRARANGGDPADVLRRHKNEFEVRY